MFGSLQDRAYTMAEVRHKELVNALLGIAIGLVVGWFIGYRLGAEAAARCFASFGTSC